MLVEVFLSTALICFAGECYPTLVGSQTKVGDYELRAMTVRDPRYGGVILVFEETRDTLYAIHRTWPGRERLYANASVYRRSVTGGCINVQPEVFDYLRSSNAVYLHVRP